MAQLIHQTAYWSGTGFESGHEHHWYMNPIDNWEVNAVTAHPDLISFSAYIDVPTELMVKDVRSYISADGGRNLLFTVRNTGSNRVWGYRVNFSFVKP